MSLDLAELVAEQRRLHVPELEGEVGIVWGRGARGRKLQSIRMAAYDPRRRLIMVHPRLDDPRMPRWFVAFVVFHELLHATLGVHAHAVHTPEFLRRERTHPDYLRARTWERDYLPVVLSASW